MKKTAVTSLQGQPLHERIYKVRRNVYDLLFSINKMNLIIKNV